MSKLVKLNCIVLVNYDHIDQNSYDATCITEPLTKPRGVLLIVRINIVKRFRGIILYTGDYDYDYEYILRPLQPTRLYLRKRWRIFKGIVLWHWCLCVLVCS